MLQAVSQAMSEVIGWVYFVFEVGSWVRFLFDSVDYGISESGIGVVVHSFQPEGLVAC